MTREQHLLTCLAEECAEVAQRASKAIRFGMEEVQPFMVANNQKRLEMELGELLGVADMLGLVPHPTSRAEKASRVNRYMELSRKLGQVD